MRMLKKCAAIVLAAAVVITAVPFNSVEAAKKPKLSKKAVSIKVGDTVKIKVKNAKKSARVKWKVTGKNRVVKLSKKVKKGKKASVKITGINAGKSTVKAIYKTGRKKKALKCKVTVYPKNIPADISTAAPTQGTVTAAPSKMPTASAVPLPTKYVYTEETQFNSPYTLDGYEKQRVINLTDLVNEYDDKQTFIRMLVESNMVNIEGIVITTSCWMKEQNIDENERWLELLFDAYDKSVDNLKAHSADYPPLDYLKGITTYGQLGYSMDDVGEGKDSGGSELIIEAVDKDDPRPVWVNLWGGANTLAQALWKVKNTRTQEEIDKFVSKLRVYDILGQDEAGAWIAKEFPDLVYIRSIDVYDFCLTKEGERLKNSITSDISPHGELGKLYPVFCWQPEGDTPAIMYQIPTGMNDPEKLDWGGFGGRFTAEKKENIRGMDPVQNEGDYKPYYMYTDAGDAKVMSRFFDAYHNDFVARLIWAENGDYNAVNHHPAAVLNGDTTKEILEISATAGETINLSAEGSSDPDDSLTYKWSIYKEPSTFKGDAEIENAAACTTTMQIPQTAAGKTIHVLLEVKDDGSPNLYSYRRLVITVN